MTFAELVKTVEKFAVDNSPTILTTIGVVGTISTAVLAGRGTLHADRILKDESEQHAKAQLANGEEFVPLTNKERAKLTWLCFAPPVACGVVTIAAVIGANHIGSKRTAAVAAAYTITDKAYTEYKEKVKEKLGENKERAIRDEIAQDRVNRMGPANTTVIIDSDEPLCMDQVSGRVFKCSMETLKKAQNDINYQILHTGYASLTEFYEKIGLPATSMSEEMGWTTDKQLELLITTTMTPDKQIPCFSIDYEATLVRDYYHFGSR